MARPRPKHHLRAVFYKNATGVEGPEDDGRGFGHTQAWHRTEWEFSPYCVPNELICAEIGRFLRLPIPPFGVTYGADGRYFFSSLNFNFDREEELPPIHPELTWQRLTHTCTGVLLFDILVANSDRHDQNLSVDKVSSPTAISVFDHDQALFGGGFDLKGKPRLDALIARLGISRGELTEGNRNCLLDVADTHKHFNDWFTRIESIPDWFIKDVCHDAMRYGLSSEEVTSARSFLTERRNAIRTIVKSHAAEFTAIDSWPWDGDLV